MSVRVGRESDAEAMAQIYVRAANSAWTYLYGAENLAALEAPVDTFRLQLASARPRHCVLVAEEHGEPVAFAATRPSEDDDSVGDRSGELDMFYSDPSVWGRGIGRQLLASVVEELRHRGFTEATLWTAEENHRPRRIYEAAGWRLDGGARERVWRGISFRELRYRIEIVD